MKKTVPIIENAAKTQRGLTYNAVWRWHFYAGLFCIPFAVWLSITGSIYLFKPQIESWLDSAYDTLTITGQRATPKAQVEAALAAVPGSLLNAYEMPATGNSAVRILVGKDKQLSRVYVHPQTLEILKVVQEDAQLMKIVFRLHGELLLGDKGSMLVELAASWMIVLIITGLFLWWPRNAPGLAGIAYPRLTSGGRTFWRDIHSVTGLWVSFFVLFLLFSGLPWAKSWGGLLKQLRQSGQTTQVKQDWTTGRSSELAERQASNTPPAGGSGHGGHEGHSMAGAIPFDATILDRLVATVAAQELAPPVLVSPPNKSNAFWSARSDSQNRTLRASLKLDATTGAIIERKDFSQRPLLDRIIGTGVAAHEGQLFGWFNQALGLFTALGVFVVAISSVVMWWGRRPVGTLGAPKAINSPPLPIYLGVIVIVLGTLLPFLGLSLIAILIIEFIALRRIAPVRNFLGVGQ